jgi:hypothetical protein
MSTGEGMLLLQLKKAQGETNERLDRTNELLAKIVEQLAYANQAAYQAQAQAKS